MTWHLRPDGVNTHRVVELLAQSDRPLKLGEMAQVLALPETTIRLHLALAKRMGAAARVGGGAFASWATPALALATREALRRANQARRLARMAASRPPPRDRNAPVQVRRTVWEPVTEAPGPNSVFALGGLT